MGLSQELAAQKVEQEEGLMRPRDIAVPFSLLLGYCRPAEELLDSVGTHTKTVFAPIAAMLDFIYPEVLRNYYKNGIVARKLREDEGLALIRRAVEADPTVKDAWRTLLENDYIVDAWQTEVGSHTYRIVAEAIEAASDKPPIEIDGEVGAALHEMAKAVLERETGK